MKIPQIIQRAHELEVRVTSPGYQTGERDLAEAQELVNLYIDELERLENTITVEECTDIDEIADKIISRWHP